MSTVHVGVILLGCAQGERLAVEHDKSWYQHYFFGPSETMRGYWAEQSDNDLVLTGEVFGWIFYPGNFPFLGDRKSAALAAVEILEESGEAEIERFQVFVVVLGLTSKVRSDGGSVSTLKHGDHYFNAVVVRTGDPFDFTAHEIGHCIGLTHSFGSPLFQASGDRPGGYGHPHCIMSARAYGHLPGGGSYTPTTQPEDPPLAAEYRARGPSLNAVTALGKGWIQAARYDPSGGVPQDFTIRSRHLGGRDQRRARHAVEVVRPDGANIVIEYRENLGWDRGQDTNYLIVAQGRGGLGDVAYPGALAGTHLHRIRVPATWGDHVYNGHGINLEVLSSSQVDGTVTVRMHPVTAPSGRIQLTTSTNLISTTVLEEGITTWEPGEMLCVEGSHPFQLIRRNEEIVVEATYSGDAGPISAAWSAQGYWIYDQTDETNLTVNVLASDAKMKQTSSVEAIRFRFAVESTPRGSRFRITAPPIAGKVKLSVGVELKTSAWRSVRYIPVELTGLSYSYGAQFERDRLTCLARFEPEIFPEYEVLIQPSEWRSIPEEMHADVVQYLQVLGQLRTTDERAFDSAAADLPRLLGVDEVQLTVVERADRLDLRPYPVLQPPPGPTLDEVRGVVGDR